MVDDELILHGATYVKTACFAAHALAPGRVTVLSRLRFERALFLPADDVMTLRVTVDPQTGAFDLGRAEPLAYAHGQYYALGRRIGKFGFSVERRRKKRPPAAAGRTGKKR